MNTKAKMAKYLKRKSKPRDAYDLRGKKLILGHTTIKGRRGLLKYRYITAHGRVLKNTAFRGKKLYKSAAAAKRARIRIAKAGARQRHGNT